MRVNLHFLVLFSQFIFIQCLVEQVQGKTLIDRMRVGAANDNTRKKKIKHCTGVD